MDAENDELDIYIPDLKQVEEWLESSPEYAIIIIGSAIWDDVSYVNSVLKFLLNDPNIDQTLLTAVGGSEKSATIALKRLIQRLENTMKIITTAKKYVHQRENSK